MNVSLEELDFAWSDFSGSVHFETILAVLGPVNRRDALHVDSAFKTGCRIFVTRDTGILSQRNELESLLGIRFFDPVADEAELEMRLNHS